MSRRKQTSDRRDERPCQESVDHMSLNVDQMPKLLVTLQRVVGHKVEGVKRESGERLEGKNGDTFVLLAKEARRALGFSADLLGLENQRINGVFGY